MTLEPPVPPLHRRLAELPALVLDPWRDKSDGEWEREPAGKWSSAQIVEHLALGLTLSAETFLARRNHAPMARRRRSPAQHVARFLVYSLQWFPPGRKAPERTIPSAEIGRRTAEAHFRAGVEAWDQVDRALLPERRANLFVKHPRMGDLTVEEWMEFHLIHARHHARQIRQRLDGGE
jgi:hypothetical protein